MKNKNSLFVFGKITAKNAISFLFFVGLVPLFFTSFMFGKYLYLNSTYAKELAFIRNGKMLYTDKLVNNLPLGIIGSFIFFIVTMLIWKILCELLIIIFRAIETYTESKQN